MLKSTTACTYCQSYNFIESVSVSHVAYDYSDPFRVKKKETKRGSHRVICNGCGSIWFGIVETGDRELQELTQDECQLAKEV